MPKTVSLENYQFLRNELMRWEEDNLLSSGQGDCILSRYEAPNWRKILVGAFSVVGTLLLGWTLIMYIAANLNFIPMAPKLIAIISVAVTSFGAAWYSKFAPGGKPYQFESLTLLGCLAYGAGVWLLAQYFQYEINYTNGPLLWGTGVLAVAIALRSKLAAVLASLLTQWALLWAQPDFYVWAVLLAGSLLGAHLTRNAWAVAVPLMGSTIWLFTHLNQTVAVCPALAFWGLLLWCSWVWHRHQGLEELGKPYLYTGLVAGLLSLAVMNYVFSTSYSFAEHGWSADALVPFEIAAIASICGLCSLLKLGKKAHFEATAAGLTCVFIIGMCYLFDPNLIQARFILNAVAMTALLCALAVYAVSLDNLWLIAITLAGALAHGCSIYFMSQGQERLLVFLAGAAVFLVIAQLLDRRPRRGSKKELSAGHQPICDTNDVR